MGADICLDDSFDSGISGYRGTRSVIRLNQPAISDGGETGATASHPPGTADGLTQSLTVPFEPQVSLPESLSILFVDDDMILRRMFSRALQRVCSTWKVTCASNGETALRLADTQSFDIIFMDQYVSDHHHIRNCSIFLPYPPTNLTSMLRFERWHP